MWIALIAAGLVVWALKNLGYLVPPRFVEGALMTRVAGLVTVALLASLVVSQTLQTGMGVDLDARVPAGIPVLAAAAVGIALAVYRHRVAPHAPERTEGGSA